MITALINLSSIRAFAAHVAATCSVLGLLLLTTAAKIYSDVPTSAMSDSSDEARIRAIIASQVIAWNAGDAKAFSASFAEDGSFTNIRGTVAYGRRAFENRHAEIFQTIFKGSKLTMSPTRIRFVRPDVAIVDIDTELRDIAAAPPGVKVMADGRIRTRLQEVLVKNNGEWRIESYHNVDVKEP